jgi:signal peptidase I
MDGRGQNLRVGPTIALVIVALFLVVSGTLAIRTFLFQPFQIPSGSMMPTLLAGDNFFVSKYAYGYTHYSLPFSPPVFSGRIFASEPQRGDVAIFRTPRNDSVDFVKRIVGLPGDRIQMINGVLQINGQPIKHERIEDFVGDDGVRVKRYRETLPNGVVYHARSHREWLLRQYTGLCGSARPLFLVGRQSRQFDRQPDAVADWLRAV